MTILPKKKQNKDNKGQENHRKSRLRQPQDRSSPGVGPSTSSARTRGHKEERREDEYNSDDENGRQRQAIVGREADDLEKRFEEHLRKSKGFTIKKMRGDGACLFRAVADQVYGDEEMHGNVRKLCMDYMAKNMDYFSQFITEDFQQYIQRKRCEHEHGNHVEMQAMAELFNRPIEVYEYSIEPINTFQSDGGKENPPIRVSYHGTSHYNSVVDPHGATIGVGLGLPQLNPGLAEKNLMNDAVKVSEEHEIEEAMLKDKLRATDWQATDEQMNDQAARESYLQWLKDQEMQLKERNVPCHSRSLDKQLSPKPSTSQKTPNSKPSSPKTPAPSTSRTNTDNGIAAAYGFTNNPYETASIMNDLPPSAFGLSDWGEDADLLGQVLAISQQEYLDNLRKAADGDQPSTSS